MWYVLIAGIDTKEIRKLDFLIINAGWVVSTKWRDGRFGKDAECGSHTLRRQLKWKRRGGAGEIANSGNMKAG